LIHWYNEQAAGRSIQEFRIVVSIAAATTDTVPLQEEVPPAMLENEAATDMEQKVPPQILESFPYVGWTTIKTYRDKNKARRRNEIRSITYITPIIKSKLKSMKEVECFIAECEINSGNEYEAMLKIRVARREKRNKAPVSIP
jgi:hypothetical protein